jgi:hypothetical protein
MATERETLWTRRGWLGGVGALTVAALAADEPPALNSGETALVEALRARAREAGLKDAGESMTAHFLGVGNAPAAFRLKALKLCEALAETVLNHFKARGFPLALSRERMAVVVLADRRSYAAWKGSAVGDTEGGHYEVNENRLVMFDFEDDGPDVGNARRLNTFTLVHEAVHQLTYNTGLLDRRGDVPKAISEGFATYGELWRLQNPKIGQENKYRLDVVLNPQNGVTWIPIDTLLTEDTLFDQEATEQQAYAQAWLLLYELIQKRPKALETYLKTIRHRRDPTQRTDDASRAFGSLSRLDSALKKRARFLG